jgi:hypothetical protein
MNEQSAQSPEQQTGSTKKPRVWSIGIVLFVILAIAALLWRRDAPSAGSGGNIDSAANFAQIITMVGEDKSDEAWMLFHGTTMAGDPSADELAKFTADCSGRSLIIEDKLNQIAGSGPPATQEQADELDELQMVLINRKATYDMMGEKANMYAGLAREGKLREYMDEQIKKAA